MIELNKLILGDCLEGMKQIPDGSVDCIICDLPYGTTRNPWDSVIPLDKLWEQYERVIKPNGAIALFSQQPFTSVLVASNMSMFKYEWIWEKDSGTGLLNSKYAPMKIHENICVFSKSAACFVKDKAKAMSYNPQMRTGFAPYKSKANNFGSNYDTRYMKEVVAESNGERYPIDIIKFNRDRDKVHPTQKPVDLIAYLVRTYTNEGDTVLDNCMGSGTTAIACIKERRHFIGFKLNKEYFDKAVRRIKAEQAQLTLF
jgi:site-specific DNA-methyltransferase (adenine-specific)